MRPILSHFLILFFLASFLFNCTSKSDNNPIIITFGSCNRLSENKNLWSEINSTNPDLWIWLGDIVYGKDGDIEDLEKKYQALNNIPGYKTLKNNSKIIGTWDDHDYGINDGGKDYILKDKSKSLFVNFISSEYYSPTTKDGVYGSYELIKNGITVKVILLDTRYNRSPLVKDTISDQRYFKSQGQILGENQWRWLENILEKSEAHINIIGSSIQLLSEEHPFEKWANFPSEKNRLEHLFEKYANKNILILSGDRHIAEISAKKLKNKTDTLYDITSSGLSHSYEEAGNETNKFRISPLIGERNFGFLKIIKKEKNLVLTIELRGPKNKVFTKKIIQY